MKYKLQIDGQPEHTATIKPSHHMIAYPTINDIPVPVRAKFVEIRKTGQTVEHIAELFNVPKDWVTLILEPQLGSTEH